MIDLTDETENVTVLILDMLQTAIEQALRPPRPHAHVVSPNATGWTFCADCFSMVFIE